MNGLLNGRRDSSSLKEKKFITRTELKDVALVVECLQCLLPATGNKLINSDRSIIL